MRRIEFSQFLMTAALAGVLAGCGSTAAKAPDVASNIRKSLDVANLKDVSVSQDRGNGVITLGGHVPADSDKQRAEAIAKSLAGPQVVANEVAVTPPGAESAAKTVNESLDKGISNNLDAAIVQNGLPKSVRYDVKNGVVRLRGEVQSQEIREQTQAVAAGVPNVQQVVNELQVKNQRASSSK